VNRRPDTIHARRAPSTPAPDSSTAAIHVRIGRVVIDAGALGRSDATGALSVESMRRDDAAVRHALEARIHTALASMLGGDGAPSRPATGETRHDRWVNTVAADIAARVRPLLPEAKP